MCGIVAVVARPGRFGPAELGRAVESLRHRGPDARGVACVHRNAHWEVWFGHTRLSVLDLSDAGAQPMVRPKRGAIVFNGEIYNHPSVRRGCAPSDWAFTSRTDTEVLLASMLESPERTLRESNGMLALALFDARRERLVLARDRLGKKPLYVYRGHDVMAVASELKAFEALGLPLTLDETGLAHFRWLSYIPGPRSIWRECTKHEPATWSEIDLRGAALPAPETHGYWDPLGGFQHTFRGTYPEALDELSGLIDDATRIRLEADVPVGVFLSGGIDSSLVAASVARLHSRSVQAFVVRPADPRHDESARALATARHLGLDAVVLPLAASGYGAMLAELAWFFDEPHAASSQMAIMAMAQEAKKQVTVVLTGDGGDEVFMGYPWVRYPQVLALPRRVLHRFPRTRTLLRTAARPPFEPAIAAASALFGLDPASTPKKLRILEALTTTSSTRDIYELFQATRLRSSLAAEDRARLDPLPFFDAVRARHPHYGWDAAIARGVLPSLSALDTLTYLRDDVLQKVDRATMARGIEARSPLLDHRIVHFGQSLPTDFKVRGRTFKRILRDLAARSIDPALARLPKRGFGTQEPRDMPAGETPIERWSNLVEARWMARWQPPRGALPKLARAQANDDQP